MRREKILIATVLFFNVALLTTNWTTIQIYTVRGATTELTPTADTYVSSREPTVNFGGQDFLELANSTDAFPGEQVIYLLFDTATVSGNVTGLQLALYTRYVPETFTVGLYGSTKTDWKEYAITYEECPPRGSRLATATVARDAEWYTWDFPSSVASAGRICLILAVEEQHDTARMSFYSRDVQEYQVEYLPHLTVTTAGAESALGTLGTLLLLGGIFGIGIVTVGWYTKRQSARRPSETQRPREQCQPDALEGSSRKARQPVMQPYGRRYQRPRSESVV